MEVYNWVKSSMEVDVAGKIIYFYGQCSTAMVNNQRVTSLPRNEGAGRQSLEGMKLSTGR